MTSKGFVNITYLIGEACSKSWGQGVSLFPQGAEGTPLRPKHDRFKSDL